MARRRGRRALAALSGAEVAAPLAGAAPAVAVQAGRNDGDAGEQAEHVLVREAKRRTVRGEASKACAQV
jgi:hypothetical protein